MQVLDWFVLALYFFGVLFLAVWLGRRQKSTVDYYLGGRRMPAGLVGISLAANQVSAISLVSAPAFVALSPGGGVRWLQYELSVPLAMAGIIVLLGPVYPRLSSASLYEYVETRFGRPVRIALSSVFLISRGLATGVALYATALVLSVGMGFPLLNVFLLLGIFAVVYTTLGGIQADIYSDVIQFVVLWLGTVAAIVIALGLLTDFSSSIAQIDPQRLQALDLSHHGFGDGETFSFWPMMLGGFFLYMSYYGCDQSQAQRLLATGNPVVTRNSLLINGLIRFPVVLTYCFFGLVLAALVQQEPEFAARLSGQKPDYLVPAFLVTYMPAGLRGLFMAGIFAAAMSSIDSALNSLSAITLEDFLSRTRRVRGLTVEKRLFLSRLLTLFWGAFCLVFGILISRSSRTVIELVNMIGSAFYGPILAVFLCGIFSHRVRQHAMLFGFLGGVMVNLMLWLLAPQVSWLWWNLIGVVSASMVAITLSRGQGIAMKRGLPIDLKGKESSDHLHEARHPIGYSFYQGRFTILTLIIYFVFILITASAFSTVLSR